MCFDICVAYTCVRLSLYGVIRGDMARWVIPRQSRYIAPGIMEIEVERRGAKWTTSESVIFMSGKAVVSRMSSDKPIDASDWQSADEKGDFSGNRLAALIYRDWGKTDEF